MWNSVSGYLPFSLASSFYALNSFNSLSGLLRKLLSGLLSKLFSGLLLLLNSLSGLTFTFCDVDVFFATILLLRAVLGDADVLFVALAALTFRGNRRGKAGFRVTFPSFLELDLTLYFGGFGFFCGCDSSVTPVRGREDTERN